jgi:PAS domain S-box-containing protein
MSKRVLVLHYAVAIGAPALALVATMETALYFKSPFLFFITAVVVSAWLGGFAPGVIAGIISSAALGYFIFPPAGSFLIQDPLDIQLLIVFGVVAFAISSLFELRARQERAHQQRARQQDACTQIGQLALKSQDRALFLDDAARIVSQILAARYCQISEWLPEQNALILRAGTGWHDGLVGYARTSAGPESLANIAFAASEPVVSENLRAEKRFSSPAFFTEHHLASGVTVALRSGAEFFGTLGAYTKRHRQFSRDEIAFLKTVGDLIANALARMRDEDSIRKHRERLHDTLTSVGDAVLVTNSDGNITFLNPIAEALIGWQASEIVGKEIGDAFNISDAETFQPIENPVVQVLREPGVVSYKTPSVLIARNRRTIPIDYIAAPMRDRDNVLIGCVMVFRDVSERMRMEQSVFRLATIVNASDDAIFSATVDGIILTWNPGAERLYGYTAAEIIGKPVAVTHPPDRLDEHHNILERLARGEPVEQHDTMRVRKDGARINVAVGSSPIKDAAGRIIGASTIARDVTERRRAEQAQHFLAQASEILVASLDYEAALTQIAQLAVPAVADWCAIHLRADAGALTQVAFAHCQPAKQDQADELARRYPPDPNAPFGVMNVIRTGKPEFAFQVTNEQIAGLARDIEHLKLLLQVGLGSYIIAPLIARQRTIGAITFGLAETERRYTAADLAMAEDIARRAALAIDNARLYRNAQELSAELEQRVITRTLELQNANTKLETEIAERQRMNEELRRLSAHLQSAREEERIRIAREIHDEVGQVLTAVKMDLALLERKLDKVDRIQVAAVKQDIHATADLVDKTIRTMREIIRELRPEILDHLGLAAAIEWQLQEFQARTGIACVFTSNLQDVNLELERSTAVFRIFQETLTNVARHAQATRVETSLNQDAGNLILQVRDNGKGVSENDLADKKTFGILGMRERAHVFGGEVTLNGAPGHGTIVTVRIPGA